MKIIYFLLILCFFGENVFSQDVFPSNTSIKTCIQKEICFGNQNSSNLFYSEANSEFYLVIDFAKFKTGIDSLDAWLDDLDDSKFIFMGQLNFDKLPALSNNGYKTIHINGTATFNGVSHAHMVDIILFSIPQEGILYRNTGNDYYDKIRVNMEIAFKPKEFKIDKKQHHLKKTISINIGSGYINQLKPGMEKFIKG